MKNLLHFSSKSGSSFYKLKQNALSIFALAILIWFSSFNNCIAQTVTNLSGFYRSGQVFITWANASDPSTLYKIYRSTSKINTAADIDTAEYLGFVDYHSSFDHNLTNADGQVRYQRIDSAGAPLNSSTGLCVALTLVNGNYYYAVTTLLDSVEDKSIVEGENSISNSIAETVSTAQPVFQEHRVKDGKGYDIYTNFVSSKYAVDQPLLVRVATLAYDFAVCQYKVTENTPMRVFFHGGGKNFISNITEVLSNDVRLEMEDFLPDSNVNTAWWGCNPAYDVLNDENNVAPASGINVNFSQQKSNMVIDWAIKNLPIDSNRIYIDGTSDGSAPAFLYALTYPERIAAVEVHTGAFSLSFLNDSIYNCSLNEGYVNRVEVNNLLGEVPTNLMCNLGINTYDAMNGSWVVHHYPNKSYPMIFSINGKNDQKLGWTEKTIFYDSLNNNRFGGYYFWDSRDHKGNDKFWNTDNYQLYRYRRNISFPAFSFCSLNEDYGKGDTTTGEPHGSINGMLDYSDSIIDKSNMYVIKVFIRDLFSYNDSVIVYPDSGFADITPRRLQNFLPPEGSMLSWQTIHNNQVVQGDTFIYSGQLITIPQVKIFKDTTTLTITIVPFQKYFRDFDADNFGDVSNSILSVSLPNGYVIDSTDCNDGNYFIHPGALEVCNSLDDNCNASIDEGLTLSSYYQDADNDNYGNAEIVLVFCEQPEGYVSDSLDCDDNNINVNPSVTEITNNGIDDDCNGYIDEFGVSISETEKGYFNISPNPSNGIFQINFNTIQEKSTVLSITNLLGQMVFEEKLEENILVQSIDLSAAEKGIYILKLQSKNEISIRQLVIH
ncbi:MAG: T9SS type A sorting domain-containing protein [Chitinophagales bacterium]|nr:T9SS type A sorting domain-containing protein [Chitinophagales bacterium]